MERLKAATQTPFNSSYQENDGSAQISAPRLSSTDVWDEYSGWLGSEN
jgi:hypothetical protein